MWWINLDFIFPIQLLKSGRYSHYSIFQRKLYTIWFKWLTQMIRIRSKDTKMSSNTLAPNVSLLLWAPEPTSGPSVWSFLPQHKLILTLSPTPYDLILKTSDATLESPFAAPHLQQAAGSEEPILLHLTVYGSPLVLVKMQILTLEGGIWGVLRSWFLISSQVPLLLVPGPYFE